MRARLAFALALCACAEAKEPEPAAASQDLVEAADPHASARARLHAFEQRARAQTDFAALPSSDAGRFGADPYALLALSGARVAVLARGDDRVHLYAIEGEQARRLASADTPHDPTAFALRGDELLVVGTGEAALARYELSSLAPRGRLELPAALAPRALAADDAGVWIADEGRGALHELRAGPGGELELGATLEDYCRGPLALARVEGWLVANCLLEHRLRLDPVREGPLQPRDFSGPRHDGPIWSFAFEPAPSGAGERLVALTGVEDHPLERRDGGFGYIDSFLYIYALREAPGEDGEPVFEARAQLNLSAEGVVTPKWARWRADERPSLVVAGYASAPVLGLRWPAGLGAAPELERGPGLPGTRDALLLADGSLLAVDPLLDALVRVQPEGARVQAVTSRAEDDRSFEQRLGEALVFTTAMAPDNDSEGKRSRFTCETCHFEGRGDGRVHFSGREFEGQRVHASSKPLLGLFPNRPHFSRAYDRDMATMVDNEFGVANRFSGRDPWASLDAERLPWLAQLPGWPGDGAPLEGEQLRRALMSFLMRWSMPQNPAARGRASFSALEREGAELFAEHCEGCHQARLVTDDPATRVGLGPLGSAERLAPWEALIFADSGPLVWASEAYVGSSIRPWVHAEGARVPSLRRLYLKWPYFTNGSARSLEQVLAGVVLDPNAALPVDHTGEFEEPGPGRLDARARRALLAFLRLL